MIITVSGTHSVRRPPDLARLHFRAQARGATADEAVTAASTTANDLVAVLKQLAAEGTVVAWTADPVTSHAWTETDPRGRPRAPVHEASVALTADFPEAQALAAFGAVIGRRAGVGLDWTDWRLADATRVAAEDEVLTGAIAQAGTRAAIMAKAAGRAGLQLVELSDSGLGANPVSRDLALTSFRAAEAAPVEVTPQDLEITATVQARFTTD